MPANAPNQQAIDWPGIRANAVAIGVREAARQAACDLPPDEQHRFVLRVLQRSHREGWIVRKNAIIASSAPSAASNRPQPLSSNVINAADSMAKSLSDIGKDTKLNLIKAAHKASKTFSGLPGSRVITQAQALRHITAAASTLHSWEEKRDAGVVLNLAVMVSGMT